MAFLILKKYSPVASSKYMLAIFFPALWAAKNNGNGRKKGGVWECRVEKMTNYREKGGLMECRVENNDKL
jgi:hypothetical protein